MLKLRCNHVVITSAGLFLGPDEIIHDSNRHEFDANLIGRFRTGSPAFLKIEKSYNEPSVPSGVSRKTLEKFFDDLAEKEHYRIPGNVEEFIDELMKGKMGYAKLRRADHIRGLTFASFEISGFHPNIPEE
jgi:hypothetical protein